MAAAAAAANNALVANIAANAQSKKMMVIPHEVLDPVTFKRYRRGKFLGGGGSGFCYEVTDLHSFHTYAAKVIPPRGGHIRIQREVDCEIRLQISMNHEHILKFYTYFTDDYNHYLLLELCANRSLSDLVRRRGRLSESEVRYYGYQISKALAYMHAKRIMHRDLKLANILLTENMTIKVADFGLACRWFPGGDKKRALCGTPTYLAPESFDRRKGHSYEVDIWAFGCIIYGMLFGRNPFHYRDHDETYRRIQTCYYTFPEKPKVSLDARLLIESCLQLNPCLRLPVVDILTHDYFDHRIMPPFLPLSCLIDRPTLEVEKGLMAPMIANPLDDAYVVYKHFYTLYMQLRDVTRIHPHYNFTGRDRDAEDPIMPYPPYWIKYWVELNGKNTIGYQLSDNSCGIRLKHGENFILEKSTTQVMVVNDLGQKAIFPLQPRPDHFKASFATLESFSHYLEVNPVTRGPHSAYYSGYTMPSYIPPPYVFSACRATNLIVFQLSNGTVQVNFDDELKMVFNSDYGSVTVIKPNYFRSFRLSLIEKFGCTEDFEDQLLFALAMMDHIKPKRKQVRH